MYCHSKAIELCAAALASMRMIVGVGSSFRHLEFAALHFIFEVNFLRFGLLARICVWARNF